ncbi:MAG: transcriptional regulator [Acidimicrobiales bacterium]
MPHLSEPRFMVAHGLRVKGFAAPPAVAAFVGLDESDVRGHLESLRTAGTAAARRGRVSGWSLTGEGRRHDARWCRDELVAAGTAPLVEATYRRFLAVNQPLLELCTDWLLRSDEPEGAQLLNDHADAAYDADILQGLAELDLVVQPLVAALASSMARFGRYGPRLAAARARIESGDRDWLTGGMIESYHTVWFELHEDLLATLGIDRHTEEHASAGSH